MEKTLSLLLDEYQKWRRSLNKSPKTIIRSNYGLKYFIKWLAETYGVATADRLRKEHIYAWQEHVSCMTTRQGRPLKPRSINSHIENVRTFLFYLAALGFVNKSHTEILQYIKVPQYLPGNILEHAKVRKLLSGIPTSDTLSYRNRVMMELLYSTGIRIGELLGIKIEDVDLRNGTAMVTGKGDKQRVVPIGRTALRYLETYIVAVRPYLLKDRKEKTVFITKHGRPIGYRGFLSYVHRYGENAGIETTLTPHTFRRSCTTELIRSGANVYHVKELLGHENLNTLRSYTRLTINDLKATHQKCHPREKDTA